MGGGKEGGGVKRWMIRREHLVESECKRLRDAIRGGRLGCAVRERKVKEKHRRGISHEQRVCSVQM